MSHGFMDMTSKWKVQSLQWVDETSPSQKAWWVCSNVKAMLTVIFNAKGIMHHEYLPTYRQDSQLGIMKCLRDKIRRKQPELWRSGEWFFSPQRAGSFIPQNSWVFGQKQDHCASLPILLTWFGPCDFFLLPKLKNPLKGKRFATIPEKEKSLTKEFMSIPGVFEKMETPLG